MNGRVLLGVEQTSREMTTTQLSVEGKIYSDHTRKYFLRVLSYTENVWQTPRSLLMQSGFRFSAIYNSLIVKCIFLFYTQTHTACHHRFWESRNNVFESH